jgi:AbrB family looped-hinge helix DNA binding protein
MFESYAVVGERGQITIPKIIRERAKIKSKEKLIVKIDNNTICIVKENHFKEKESKEKIIKGYKEMNMINKKLTNDFKHVLSDVNDSLGDY